MPGFDTNKKRREAEMKCRASALGATGIRNEDIAGTAVHVKCLQIKKPERPESDGLDRESPARRRPRSRAAGGRPGGGATRRFMERMQRTQRMTMRRRVDGLLSLPPAKAKSFMRK